MTIQQAARAPLLGASMLVTGAGSVGANRGAETRVGVLRVVLKGPDRDVCSFGVPSMLI